MAETGTTRPLKTGAIFVVVIAALVGWLYYQSPGQAASRQMKAAAKAKAAGNVVKAAEVYADVAVSRSALAASGAEGLGGLLDAGTLQPLPAAEASQVLSQALRARSGGEWPMPTKRFVALGWTLVDAHATKDPVGAKQLLDVVAPLETDKPRVDAAAVPLLERIVMAQPANGPAAMDLAERLDRRNQCERCEALLRPHSAALGATESARILGQIFASKGLLDESYALLQPYTADRLKKFVALESEYRATLSRIETQAVETLRKGRGPTEFYERYDRATEAGKRDMVSAFIDERISSDGNVKSQLQAVRDAAAIVPVALDLGIITLQRAQKLSDPAARNAQLQAAEKVLLAIRGVAGESDAYRLHLGQVYYWLGKQAEGKALFDELLAKRKRDSAVLYEVGAVLRSIGAEQEARALAEEAHRRATDNSQRWQAAQLRSMMSKDTEDELAWLERSDSSSAHVRSSIHSARARVAIGKGQRAVAKREYQLAVDELQKMPENATQLNSLALGNLALYALEGDPAHSEAGLAQLDKALSLLPTDSILLLNSAEAARAAAAAAFIGPVIDVPLLRTAAEFEMIAFMHKDQASLDRIRSELRANAAVKKSLSYSEKAALLAPRNATAYRFPMAVAAMLEDADAAERIAAQAAAAKIDLTDSAKHLQDIVDGVDLPKVLDGMAQANQRTKATLQLPAVQQHPATWAIAVERWVDLQVTMARWGRPIDADGMVNVARKASARHPSAGTSAVLMNALETRAAMRLLKTSPSFASALSGHARVVDLSTLFVLQIDEDPAFRRLAMADPDVVEVLGLVRERETRYPSKVSVWAWLMLRHSDPARAEAMARRLAADRSYAAHFKLRDVFEPPNADAVIDRYHFALARGDRAEAQRVLDEARKAKIKLPDLAGRQLTGPAAKAA